MFPVGGLKYNAATGGTTADVANYNGTGQTWRVHTFTTSGTFTATTVVRAFSTLIVGAGGGCGSRGNGAGGGPGGGGGGGVTEDTAAVLTAGAHTIVVGSGGAGGGGVGVHGVAGASGGGSTIDGSGSGGGTASAGVYATDSTPGATSGSPQSTAGAARVGVGGSGYGGGAGGVATGLASTITGASYSYGIGGGHESVPVTNYGQGASRDTGGYGANGVVIIAYQVG